jgi:hypothetical protein
MKEIICPANGLYFIKPFVVAGSILSLWRRIGEIKPGRSLKHLLGNNKKKQRMVTHIDKKLESKKSHQSPVSNTIQVI